MQGISQYFQNSMDSGYGYIFNNMSFNISPPSHARRSPQCGSPPLPSLRTWLGCWHCSRCPQHQGDPREPPRSPSCRGATPTWFLMHPQTGGWPHFIIKIMVKKGTKKYIILLYSTFKSIPNPLHSPGQCPRVLIQAKASLIGGRWSDKSVTNFPPLAPLPEFSRTIWWLSRLYTMPTTLYHKMACGCQGCKITKSNRGVLQIEHVLKDERCRAAVQLQCFLGCICACWRFRVVHISKMTWVSLTYASFFTHKMDQVGLSVNQIQPNQLGGKEKDSVRIPVARNSLTRSALFGRGQSERTHCATCGVQIEQEGEDSLSSTRFQLKSQASLTYDLWTGKKKTDHCCLQIHLNQNVWVYPLGKNKKNLTCHGLKVFFRKTRSFSLKSSPFKMVFSVGCW